MVSSLLASATLHIDLGALARNWQRLDRMSGRATTSAVLKANAYGIGIEQAAPALWKAGCRDFFVAHPDEGLRLRASLPQARIFVLNGLPARAVRDFREARLVPVLNDPGQIENWQALARAEGTPVPAAIHIDTGMTRLGLLGADVERLKSEPGRFEGLAVALWLTHPACADLPDHPMNAEQLAAFRSALDGLPPGPSSAANSAAIFLGPDWHLDMVRPGVALYGSSPAPLKGEPMAEVVRLEADILQISRIRRSRNVGYGATQSITTGSRIATCGVGYADGYVRSLSNSGYGILCGRRVPLVGRVSMDLITFDISDVPEHEIGPDSRIVLMGGGVNIDELAALGGTIAYELLTGLGSRYARQYVDGVQA